MAWQELTNGSLALQNLTIAGKSITGSSSPVVLSTWITRTMTNATASPITLAFSYPIIAGNSYQFIWSISNPTTGAVWTPGTSYTSVVATNLTTFGGTMFDNDSWSTSIPTNVSSSRQITGTAAAIGSTTTFTFTIAPFTNVYNDVKVLKFNGV
jgi:hypothetical protein